MASGTVGNVYGGLMGVDQLFSHGGRTGRLDTGMSDRNFHNGIWQRYQTGARLHFGTDPAAPGDTRTPQQIEEQTPAHYYTEMRLFNAEGGNVHRDIAGLLASIGGQPAAQQNSLITNSLPVLTARAATLLRIFRYYTNNPGITGLRTKS